MRSGIQWRRGVRGKAAHIGPNMTPMVDVVLCILIFFMLGSTFLTPELYLQSKTPSQEKAGGSNASKEPALPAVKLDLRLTRRDGETFLEAFGAAPLRMSGAGGNVEASHAAVDQLLREKKRGMSDDVLLLIVPDKGVAYQDVITVYDACTKAQFKQVAFAPAQ